MSYQRARGEAIAQLTKYGLPYHVIEVLLRAATTINRLAELACSSEAADRDRIKCPAWEQRGIVVLPDPPRRKNLRPCLCDLETYIDPATGKAHPTIQRHTKIPRIRLQDWHAEQRAIRAMPPGWAIVTSGDPRGYTLRVVPPAYVEENKTRAEHDPRTIGIPPGPSRLRW